MTDASNLIDPARFVTPDARLLIDTSVFMDDDPRRKGGLGALLERCGETIRRNDNPIVVLSDVVAELTKHSTMVDPERTESIRRAGVALNFIEDTRAMGLVRTDIGRESDHYADSVFEVIFKHFADRYDLCLLINDITPLLQVRLLSQASSKKLVAGMLTREGLVEVETDQHLYERGSRKLARKLEEGDNREIAVLEPLLDRYRLALGTKEPARRVARPPVATGPATTKRATPFGANVALQTADQPLKASSIPSTGDTVSFTGAGESGKLVIGQLIGEGGEGKAYAAADGKAVKIFDEDDTSFKPPGRVVLADLTGTQCCPAR